MKREDVQQVVRTTLLVTARVAKRTRSQADDLLAAILQANEDRIVEVVAALCQDECPAPTEEQITRALERVGINL